MINEKRHLYRIPDNFCSYSAFKEGDTTPTLQMWDYKEPSFKKDSLRRRKRLTNTPAGERGQCQRQ